jgi:hypothetical protein
MVPCSNEHRFVILSNGVVACIGVVGDGSRFAELGSWKGLWEVWGCRDFVRRFELVQVRVVRVKLRVRVRDLCYTKGKKSVIAYFTAFVGVKARNFSGSEVVKK